MKISEILVNIKAKLQTTGVDSADIDARILLQHAMNMTREELLLNNNEKTSLPQQELLDEYVRRRMAHEPVSRILGLRSFWNFDFKISKGTLDPRADSETLVEAVLKYLSSPSCRIYSGIHSDMQQLKDGRPNECSVTGKEAKSALKILDLGTGSGCLLLSLLQEFPFATGVGIDACEDAIITAHENARAMGLHDRAELMIMAWNDFAPTALFDIVISNPPYIAENVIATLEPEVRLYDPLLALVGGKDGCAAYREIVARLNLFLKSDGVVFFEIGYDQASAVKDILEQAGFSVLRILPDLAGHDRCIVAQRARVNTPL